MGMEREIRNVVISIDEWIQDRWKKKWRRIGRNMSNQSNQESIKMLYISKHHEEESNAHKQDEQKTG